MHYSDNSSIFCLPIGGCGQFGANMTIYGYAGDLLAIDCGIGFADDTFPGVDILTPDVDWVAEHADKLKALIITHAHEDHIGAVAWVWPRLKCPVFLTEFAALVLERKLGEQAYQERPDIHIIEAGKPFDVAGFEVHSSLVTHSVPETLSLMLDCPVGRVVHTGDWNLDPTPVIGKPTDLEQFKAWGDDGVLAVVGDSTNAPIPGRSASEAEAAKGLETVFQGCTGRIAITIFSSNIARMISIHRAAESCGRQVALIGRSLKAMADTAKQAGIMPEGVNFVSEQDIGHLPNDKIVLIVTGSQGEPRAALSKIARGMNRDISLSSGDTVIFSARSIPGNERGILDIKNLLARDGVHVVDADNCAETIHVSGHPKRDELSQMLEAIRPQLVVPVHGEYQMQLALAELAQQQVGAQTSIPGNGTMMRLSKDAGIEVIDHLDITPKAIEFKRVVDLNDLAIQQRRRLSFNGAIFMHICVDESNGNMLDCQITMLGLIDEASEFGRDILDSTYDAVEAAFNRMKVVERLDADRLVDKLRPATRRVVKDRMGARPATEIHVSVV